MAKGIVYVLKVVYVGHYERGCAPRKHGLVQRTMYELLGLATVVQARKRVSLGHNRKALVEHHQVVVRLLQLPHCRVNQAGQAA